ncbi:Uncharacterised protein [Aedoeadaptatus ivorii]|uniref:Uncharacterized protein n=1 Tax=Aedoeadaptatus ivorii TaxID=54006 RepID=A0A3S4ZPM5_9FIRM|nr:hypothetical protein [Peptoniphilus ivorii]VEJ34348.1 Uncharacterised protein [Peptoniphilus ivorii]
MNFVVNSRYFQDKNAYKKGLKILLLVYALPILLFILPFVAFPISLGLTLLLRTNLPSEAVLAVLMNNDYLHCIQIFSASTPDYSACCFSAWRASESMGI